MMQFMWRYVEELVGKGLSLWVLAQFFYYAALTLVPMSLPLGVLLASLITFGNMGEKLELLAMKAAGVPLIRILASLIIFNTLICGWSYYFQNYASPNATKQLASMLWGMKQKNPEMEIPEGMFYNDIPGYNLYVKHKNKETGRLYEVVIYSHSRGYEDAQIVVCDSAHIMSTEDQRHLKLIMWGGERFQNMQNQGGMSARAYVPYMRESFMEEVDLIAFDNNFSALDADLFNGNAQVKNFAELTYTIDSLEQRIDSVGHDIYQMQLRSESMDRSNSLLENDSASLKKMTAMAPPVDSVSALGMKHNSRQILQGALRRVNNSMNEYEFRAAVTNEYEFQVRRHDMERHKKFVLSLACLMFFFIGAPLGAIIRKGGLGVPVVTSVLIFILYYIINVAGEKMAKTGDWAVWLGMWISTLVLAPCAVWITYKANKDSNLMNADAYILWGERIWIKAKILYRKTNETFNYRRGSR